MDLYSDENPAKVMKVEIHAHTEKYSPCSMIPPRELVLMAEASGYDALFITEHARVWSARELAGLREMCERVHIFPGIEISCGDGVDLLVLGADDPVYETLTAPNEIFAQACADGYLTVLAHPFRWLDQVPEFCALADAIEAQTCNHGIPEQVERARRYAEEHNMAALNASDAHGLNFMNKFWVETDTTFDTPQEFRRLILSGHYRNHARSFDMPLPPPFKAAEMSELTEEDLMALWVQPTA